MVKYILIAVVVTVMLGLLFQALPGEAQGSQAQEAPKPPVSAEPLPSNTGYRPHPVDLSHLTGQTMPDGD